MKLRSIGPDKNPRSIWPDIGPEYLRIGPDLTVAIEFLGIGWSGIEEKKFELSKAEALSIEAVQAVERAVEVLAEMEAPEMVRYAVVCWAAEGSSKDWIL